MRRETALSNTIDRRPVVRKSMFAVCFFSCAPICFGAGLPGSVRAVVYAPGGGHIVAGYEDGKLKVWSVAKGAIEATWEGDGGGVYALAVTPDGKLIASGSDDGTIGLWSWPDGRRMATLKEHQEAVLGLAVTPDGKTLVSGSGDATVRLWSLPEGRPLAKLEGHAEAVLCVAVSPDGRTVASGSADTDIRLWSLPDGKALATLKLGKGRGMMVKTPKGSARAAAIAPDGKRLFVAALDAAGGMMTRSPRGAIRIVSLDTNETVAWLKEHTSLMTALAIAPDGGVLASAGADRTVRLWSLPQGTLKSTLKHAGTVYALAMAPDGKSVAAGDITGTIRIWSLADGSALATFVDPDAAATPPTLYPVKTETKGLWGYVDRRGKMAIEAKYDAAEEFSEGLAAVTAGKNLSYIDASGKEVIALPAGTKDPGSFHEDLARVTRGKLAGYIDKTGQFVIPAQLTLPEHLSRMLQVGFYRGSLPGQSITEYRSTFSTWSGGYSEGLEVFTENKKLGYMDKAGKPVVPAQYEVASSFHEGLALVRLNKKWGFVDSAGTAVIATKYDDAIHFAGGSAAVKFGKDWICIDKSGKTVLNPDGEARPLSEGLMAVVGPKGKMEYVDAKGAVVIEPRFDYSWDFHDGRARAIDVGWVGWRHGFVNRSGKMVDYAAYDSAGDFRDGAAWINYDFADLEWRQMVVDRMGIPIWDNNPE